VRNDVLLTAIIIDRSCTRKATTTSRPWQHAERSASRQPHRAEHPERPNETTRSATHG